VRFELFGGGCRGDEKWEDDADGFHCK
jgi:hypothetical protein